MVNREKREMNFNLKTRTIPNYAKTIGVENELQFSTKAILHMKSSSAHPYCT